MPVGTIIVSADCDPVAFRTSELGVSIGSGTCAGADMVNMRPPPIPPGPPVVDWVWTEVVIVMLP